MKRFLARWRLPSSLARRARAPSEHARQLIKKTSGQQLVVPSDAESTDIKKKAAPVVDDWLAATPDGRETLDQFTAALAAVSAGK
jgi:hypothetical protein